MVRKLEQEHIAFLTSHDTLQLWAGKTLKMRTVLFHRMFPDKRIAMSSLRRLYLQHGIKRKKVRQEKYLPGHVQLNFDDRRRDCVVDLDRAVKEKRKLIFLDEINFTKRSFQSEDWSVRRDNQHVDQRDIYTGYRSVIAAVS